MLYLHHLLLSYPDVKTKMRYKIPFYDRNHWVCYLNPTKDGKVELGFVRGNELSNEQGLLEARDRMQVMGILLEKIEDIPEKTLHEILQEAFLLDENVKYASKRKLNK